MRCGTKISGVCFVALSALILAGCPTPGELEKVEEERDELQAELEQVQEERDELWAELEQVTAEYDELHSELEKTRAALSDRESDLEELEQAREELAARVDRLRADQDEMTEQRAQLRWQLSNAREELESAQEQLEQLESQLAERGEELEQLGSELESAQAEASQLQEEVATLRTARGQLQEERDALQTERDALQAERNELAGRLEEMDIEVEATGEAVAVAQAEDEVEPVIESFSDMSPRWGRFVLQPGRSPRQVRESVEVISARLIAEKGYRLTSEEHFVDMPSPPGELMYVQYLKRRAEEVVDLFQIGVQSSDYLSSGLWLYGQRRVEERVEPNPDTRSVNRMVDALSR